MRRTEKGVDPQVNPIDPELTDSSQGLRKMTIASHEQCSSARGGEKRKVSGLSIVTQSSIVVTTDSLSLFFCLTASLRRQWRVLEKTGLNPTVRPFFRNRFHHPRSRK